MKGKTRPRGGITPYRRSEQSEPTFVFLYVVDACQIGLPCDHDFDALAGLLSESQVVGRRAHGRLPRLAERHGPSIPFPDAQAPGSWEGAPEDGDRREPPARGCPSAAGRRLIDVRR